MKVLLISAAYIDSYGAIKFAAGRYFPLGLGYIAAFLREKGHDVLLYEPEAQQLDSKAIQEIFLREKPEMVGITSATPNFDDAVKLAEMAKSSGNCTVVYGGVHASAMPEFIMAHYADYFDFTVIGEGEYTMAELLETLSNKADLTKVNGICFNDRGTVVKTDPRPPISDLDSLPYPARDLIPTDLFMPNMHNVRYKKCFTLLTSRGCPYNCSFCASYVTLGKRYRMHSAEYVLNEMTYLKETYGAEQIIINDDTFTLNKERLIKVCNGMIERKLNLKWFCFSQIAVVDEDILKLMKQAGCYNIGFGVESASEKVLKSIGKMVPLDKCKQVIRYANKLGMKTQAFFIFGKENETLTDMEETIQYALSINPTLSFFNMLVPYPGTRDFDCFFEGIPYEQIEWKNFVAIGEKSVFSRADKESINIEKIIYKANLKFYFRLSQIVHLLSKIRTFYELKCYIKGGLGLIFQMVAWRK